VLLAVRSIGAACEGSRMDISIEVPGHLVGRVVVSLLHELAPVAESVYVRANACIGGDDDAENLLGDLNELRDIEDALDDLGLWVTTDQVTKRVTGHPVLLGDVVYGALTDQVEDLRERCASYHDGSVDLEVVSECLDGVGELLRLLAAVHDAGPR
jgi:hypothetical protein